MIHFQSLEMFRKNEDTIKDTQPNGSNEQKKSSVKTDKDIDSATTKKKKPPIYPNTPGLRPSNQKNVPASTSSAAHNRQRCTNPNSATSHTGILFY